MSGVRGAGLALLFFAAADAAPLKCEGVSVELVGEHAAIQPGKPFAVGVIFRPDPGFHVYWRQPGLVGMAPSITWNAPPGFVIGETLWPEPERVTMATWGAWGYRRPVCLVTEITPPRGFIVSASVPTITISADLVWMCCSKTCHPGSAQLKLTLPVSETTPDPAEAAPHFVATRASQPVRLPNWKFAARRTGDGFALEITPSQGASVPEDAYFFNFQRLVDSHHEQIRRSHPGGGVTLEMKLTELPEENPRSLDGILHSKSGFGRHRSIKVSAPIEPGS
jgi:thiol:disulfide interchange protein DsbD